MFIDRLNALRRKLGLAEVEPDLLQKVSEYDPVDGYKYLTPSHSALDECDKICGIITRHGRRNIYGLAHEQPIVQEYAGARLARLERHVFGNQAPPYFWLGKEAA
jgi:hypothetical protein